MKIIDLSREVKLPLDTGVVQRYGIIGTIGSGKSNDGQLLAEQMLHAGVQCVVLDPTGIWWSLLLAADGKAPSGLPVIVLGGKNGALPIDPDHGERYADWVVEKRVSVIFDLKFLRPGKREKFVADFCRALYYKKGQQKERTVLHLFLEEAQRYAPQSPDSPAEKISLSVLREIAEMGRNDGWGLTIITQAPQAVSKRLLNLTECLIVHQTIGKHERKAIIDWAIDKNIDLSDTDLSTLEVGEAILYSPRWLKVLKKVHCHLKATYNASSTLKFGEKSRNIAPELPETALADLRVQLAEAAVAAEQNDPGTLRRRIIELERTLRTGVQVATGVKAMKPPKMIRVEKPILTAADRKQLLRIEKEIESIHSNVALVQQDARALVATMAAVPAALERRVQDVLAGFAQIKGRVAAAVEAEVAPRVIGVDGTGGGARGGGGGATWTASGGVGGAGHAPATVTPIRSAVPSGDYKLKGKTKDMLAFLKAMHPSPVPRRRLALMVGIKSTGSTFSDYVSILKTQELVTTADGFLALTEAGLALTKTVSPVMRTPDALFARWSPKLKGKAKTILGYIMQMYPAGCTREELGAQVELPHTGSTFSDYLSILRTAGLIREEGSRVFASDDLYE